MSDLPPESRPAPPPDPDSDATRALPAQQGATSDAGPPPAKQRLRDRLWSFRAVIAVALASVIIGGLGGAALANDHDRRFGPGQGRVNRGGPGGPDGPPWMLDERQRDRMKQWRDQRGMGQRQWGPDGPNGVQPSDLPAPTSPTPNG